MVKLTVMRWFLLLFLSMSSFLALGTSATFNFKNESSALTSTARWNGDDVWKNATTNKCYQRHCGVGMISSSATKGASGMIADWSEEPIAVHMVNVNCVISSKTPANKELILSLTANYADAHTETHSVSFAFSKEEVSTLDTSYPLTLYFSLPYQTSHLCSLMLQNQTEGAYIFEIASISLSFEPEPIVVDAEVFTTGKNNEAVAIVKSIAGGTGMGYTYCWSLENKTSQTYTTEDGYPQFRFEHPEEEGSYYATLTVCDSAMNVFTKTYMYGVGALAAPRILEISDVKRSSFRIQWENGSSVAPRYYSLVVRQPSKTIQKTFTPYWTIEGEFATTELNVCLPITSFEDVQSLVLNANTWTGETTIEISEDGEEWMSLYYNEFMEGVVLTPALKNFERIGGPYYIRIPNRFASMTVELSGNVLPVYEEKTILADGLIKECLIEDLPASSTVQVYLKTIFSNKQSMQAEVQTVQLAPLPPFQQVSVHQSYLFPTWPEDVPTARVDYYAEISSKCEGLYLTRIFHGKQGKGIILTNTSSKNILLSNYSLQKETEKGSVTTTQFDKITLPPRSEMLFVYSTPSIPLQMPGNTMKGALNFADKGVLSLMRGNEVVNSLTVKTGYVTRLEEEGVESVFEEYDADLALPSLWAPWGQREEVLIEEKRIVAGDVMVEVPMARFRKAYPLASRIFARIVSTDGEVSALPLEVELWRQRFGYRFRLR